MCVRSVDQFMTDADRILNTTDLQQAPVCSVSQALPLSQTAFRSDILFAVVQQGQIVWHNKRVLFSPMEWKNKEKFDIKYNNSMDFLKFLLLSR